MPEELTTKRRDAAIARIAARQHGVVSVHQLYSLGVSSSAIGDRVTAGRLHRLHRGAYAVGHLSLSNQGRWMGAVLACGPDAVLSHRSAAELWQMLPVGSRAGGDPPIVHVTIAGEGRHRGGIRAHRSSTLSPGDFTLRRGIPVTKPARTLEDLRRTFPRSVFAAALRQAEFLRLPIGKGIVADHTRSELEARFLALVRHRRLPLPEVNARVDRFVVDFLWRRERLIVEVDGWESHGTRSAFEEDRARDARLRLLGFDVVRFTWRQLEEDSPGVARAIRALLDAAA
jgi:very-short-patch-repair endonuclease